MIVWLLHNTLGALPLALVAFVAQRMLPKRPALVHFAWLLVLLRLVVPPALFGPFGGASTTDNAALAVQASGIRWSHEVVGWITNNFGNNWSAWLGWIALAIFGTGLIVFLMRELRGLGRLRKGLRGASEASPEIQNQTRQLAEYMGVDPPKIGLMADTQTPFVWSQVTGGGPWLVLPNGADTQEPSVLAHEMAHLRRKDHWVAWIELLVLAFHWWNPLAWFARRFLRRSAELACDAWAVEHFPHQRREYAGALLDVLERSNAQPAPVRTIRAIGWNYAELDFRLRRILKGDDSARLPRLGAAVVTLLFCLSLPGLGAPSLERFENALPSIPNGLAQSQWTTVLENCDRALETNPADEQALDRRGLALMGLGRFEEAALVFQAQIDAGYRPERSHYNLACALSLSGRLEAAVDALESSIELGMQREYLAVDPDFDPLRGLPGFQALLPSE